MTAGEDNLLLDSDVVIALFRRDERVRKKLNQTRQMFIPVIVAGEGNLGSRKAAEEQRKGFSLLLCCSA